MGETAKVRPVWLVGAISIVVLLNREEMKGRDGNSWLFLLG